MGLPIIDWVQIILKIKLIFSHGKENGHSDFHVWGSISGCKEDKCICRNKLNLVFVEYIINLWLVFIFCWMSNFKLFLKSDWFIDCNFIEKIIIFEIIQVLQVLRHLKLQNQLKWS